MHPSSLTLLNPRLEKKNNKQHGKLLNETAFQKLEKKINELSKNLAAVDKALQQNLLQVNSVGAPRSKKGTASKNSQWNQNVFCLSDLLYKKMTKMAPLAGVDEQGVCVKTEQ
eukprot:jgi/Bigna1/137786/aug1.41_g12494